ncbi:MAG: caspase family protein [Burkholderiales bacterium]
MIRREAYQQPRGSPDTGSGGGVQELACIDHRIPGARSHRSLAWMVVFMLLMAMETVAESAEPFGKRVALVIGNARYANVPLANPENDAKAVSSTLRRLGFEVNEQLNLNARDFRRVMRDFARRIQEEEGAAVLYYAGHGVQIDGRNYLLPIDINLRDAEEVKDDSIDIDEVFVSRIERARMTVRIVILDACRDNPFRGTTTRNIRPAGGLAEMNARGALIAYSSAPGAAAEDGLPGTNSVFTRHLVEEMPVEGIEVEQMFKNVRVKVLRDTNQRQIPWTNTSLTVNFSFNPARGPSPAELARIEQERKTQNSLVRVEQERSRLEQELKQRISELEEARRALALSRNPPARFETRQRDDDQRLLEDLDRQEKDLLRLQDELDRARRITPQAATPTTPRSPVAASSPVAGSIEQERERRLLEDLDRQEQELLRLQAELERTQASARPEAAHPSADRRCTELLNRMKLGEQLRRDDRAYLEKECRR